MPGRGTRRVAGRIVAGAIFPRRLHIAGAGRRNRLPKQGGGLRHPVQVGGRGAEHNRCRSTPSRRRDRLHHRTPHLGPEPAAPSARPLPRSRRRLVDGRNTLDILSTRLLPAVRVLSSLFRRLFLEKLQEAFAAGKLAFFGSLARFADTPVFSRYLAKLRRVEWVV